MKYFAILITAAAMFGALSATAQQPGGGRGQQGGGFGGPPRGAQGGGQGGAQGQGGRQGGARSNAVLQAIDADGDHEISVLEIEGAAAALRKLDKNQDGKLTHDEIHPDGHGSRWSRRSR